LTASGIPATAVVVHQHALHAPPPRPVTGNFATRYASCPQLSCYGEHGKGQPNRGLGSPSPECVAPRLSTLPRSPCMQFPNLGERPMRHYPATDNGA
jgi:hypothetical protein